MLAEEVITLIKARVRVAAAGAVAAVILHLISVMKINSEHFVNECNNLLFLTLKRRKEV